MINNTIIAGTLLLSLVAIGEIISIITKSRISMFFIVIIGYIILIWTGIFPKSLIIDSKWNYVGMLLGTSPIIIHMGTLIPVHKLKEQWRTVIVALFGIIFGAGSVLICISSLFSYNIAVAGAGPLTGGLVAFMLTSQGLKEVGASSLIIIPALILSFQTLVGMSLGSYFLNKYVKNNFASFSNYTNSNISKKQNLLIPLRYQSEIIFLFLVLLGASIAVIVENYLYIPYSLIALLIGILGKSSKIYPEGVLQKANAYSICFIGLIFSVVVSLNSITLNNFLQYGAIVFWILVIGVVGIIVGGIIASYLVGYDKNLAICVALTSIIAFPGDYILSKEVSRSMGGNQENEKIIFSNIITPMLIGGFTTVTIGSVVVTSILIKTI